MNTAFGVTPEQAAWWRLNGLHHQLAGDILRLYENYAGFSKHTNPSAWDRFDAIVDAMADHLHTTGEDPHINNSTWQAPTGLHYIGNNADVYLAVARERAESLPGNTNRS